MSLVLAAAGLCGVATAAAVHRPAAGGRRLGRLAPQLPSDAPDGLLSSSAVSRLGAVVAASGAVIVQGPVAGLLVLCAAALLQRHRHAGARARADQEERDRAVEAWGVLAGELRAGRPPPDALAAAADVAAGPCAARLLAAAATARFGGDVSLALCPPGSRSAVDEALEGLAVCWGLCTLSGSGLAAGVDRLAEDLTARTELARVIEAELAGPRATAALLALLPLAGVLLAAGLGAAPLHVLLHTPFGAVCLAAGLGLDLLGLRWTGRIVRAAQA